MGQSRTAGNKVGNLKHHIMEKTINKSNNEALIPGLRTAMQGQMENEKIENAISYLTAQQTTSMPAKAIFSNENVKVQTTDPVNLFTGTGNKRLDAAASGKVMTNNEAALFAGTVSFYAAPGNNNILIIFLDEQNNPLGQFQGIIIAGKAETDKGNGHWNNG